MSTAIVWLRRDLRIADQPVLAYAAQHHRHVVPLYIHAPAEEAPWSPGAASNWWLHHSLTRLAADFSALGTPLVVRQGSSLVELQRVITQVNASAVYWSRLYEPAVIARDSQIKQDLRALGIATHSFNAALLFEPWQLATGAGEPYRVYTPMWKKAEPLLDRIPPPQAGPSALIPAPVVIDSLAIADLKLLPSIAWDAGFYAAWTPGEAGALQQLERFMEAQIHGYKTQRDFPAKRAAVSGLSPHLHFGELSPRQALVAAQMALGQQTQPGAHASIIHFIKELFWREFSHHLLYHFPHTPDAAMYTEKFARFAWRAAPDYADDLRAWQQGRTGIPIVDAGMRELWATGWMHNRVRMIVASFLTKNLLIPWQEGARWFWDTLVDASLPQNTMGWQWSAGCGADAAPYFRIFNPVLQSEKFDPDGVYLRRWLPELQNISNADIHAPWLAKSSALSMAKVQLGIKYPLPIVDLAASRQRALAVYGQMRADS